MSTKFEILRTNWQEEANAPEEKIVDILLKESVSLTRSFLTNKISRKEYNSQNEVISETLANLPQRTAISGLPIDTLQYRIAQTAAVEEYIEQAGDSMSERIKNWANDEIPHIVIGLSLGFTEPVLVLQEILVNDDLINVQPYTIFADFIEKTRHLNDEKFRMVIHQLFDIEHKSRLDTIALET